MVNGGIKKDKSDVWKLSDGSPSFGIVEFAFSISRNKAGRHLPAIPQIGGRRPPIAHFESTVRNMHFFMP